MLTARGAESWLRVIVEEIGACSTWTLDEEEHSLRSGVKYDEELSGNFPEEEISEEE